MGHSDQFKIPQNNQSLKTFIGSPLQRSVSMQNLSMNSTGGPGVQSKNYKKTRLSTNEIKIETPQSDRYLPKLTGDVCYLQEKIFHNYDGYNGNDEKSLKLNETYDDPFYEERNQLIREQLLDEEMRNVVLSYENDLPTSYEAGTNSSVKFQTKTDGKNGIKPNWLKRRFIPKTSERTLDAPDLVDNFYYNILDWGGNNQISVGLEDHAYLWDATSGNISKLEPPSNNLNNLANPNSSDHVCSIKWSGNESSSCLAIGRDSGHVQLWDARTQKCIRKIKLHNCRIGSLSWNRHILSTGCQNGQIVNLDVRVSNCILTKLENYHTQEVCSLFWSHDGRHLASGGNDNLVNVWNMNQVVSNLNPLQTFTDHRAAVKSLAWHPRENNLLATGGGTSCGIIYFWNIYNGCRLAKVETHSQVSGLYWSNYYNEFISAHGYPHHRLTIWNYPNLNPICHLNGHTQRILSITSNPDGSTIASVGADETLRLWRCFQVPKNAQMRPGLDVTRKSTYLNLIR